MSEFGYRCEGCQTKLDNEGNSVPVDKVRRGLNSRGTAETLARIHTVKTGHNPEVLQY